MFDRNYDYASPEEEYEQDDLGDRIDRAYEDVKYDNLLCTEETN